jgi:pimeloyl-ACP methyl ester carboxylesterase
MAVPLVAVAAAGAAPTYEPEYATVPCDGVVPTDPRVECGVLTVPEDRAHPKRGDVRLAVAIIRSAVPDPLPDPIVYFSGGPGESARNQTERFLGLDFGGRRDVILFDQRGTGVSTPSLDCPEAVAPTWEGLAAPAPARVERALHRKALARCRARLVATGIDLDDFDTPATVADAEDLRRALGIEQWNLFGRSYGTTVALEVLRRDPEGVRSAVLDSVFPTDVASDAASLVRSARRALEQLFAGCEASPACSAAYPSFRTDVDALVEEWNDEPFETDVADPQTGENRHLVITGDDVTAGLWSALYDDALIPLIPSLVGPLRERGDAAASVVQQLASSGTDTLRTFAEAVTPAVDCADRQRLVGAPAEQVADRNPDLATLLALGDANRACDVVDVESVPPAFNRPVRSDLPVLILGDDYDPVTPPADGIRAARTLPRSTTVATHGLGHTPALTNPCTLGILEAFLATPNEPPDTTCTDEMEGPIWVLP